MPGSFSAEKHSLAGKIRTRRRTVHERGSPCGVLTSHLGTVKPVRRDGGAPIGADATALDRKLADAGTPTPEAVGPDAAIVFPDAAADIDAVAAIDSGPPPMDAAASPLPSDDTTPPVTKMYFTGLVSVFGIPNQGSCALRADVRRQ